MVLINIIINIRNHVIVMIDMLEDMASAYNVKILIYIILRTKDVIVLHAMEIIDLIEINLDVYVLIT